MSIPRYEVVEARIWRNTSTGATASVYGACPWTSQTDKLNWKIDSVGWTIRDNRSGTVGIGRKPFETRDGAQGWIDAQLEREGQSC